MAAPSVLPDADSRKGWTYRLRGWPLFLAAAVVVFLLYRPDTNAPFEIIDFSETLPYLTGGRDFGERFSGLVGYYLQHGRAAFALSAGLAAKWSLFGWWTPGWQLSRYVLGLMVVVLAWRLLRELGANHAGASFGAALFIVSETAAPGWLKPQVNEPLGTLLLLAASLLGCRYQATQRPRLLAVAFAALLAAMIIVKETLVAATFFPVVLALCVGPQRAWQRPERSSRNVTLVVSSALAIAIVSVPVLWAITQAAPGGYAREFGNNAAWLENAVFGVLPALVPFTPVSQPSLWAPVVGDFAWMVLLISGLVAATDPATARHARWLILLSLALPLARLIVYLPWPLQFPYYSIPYLLGAAIITSLGVTRLMQSGSTGRLLAASCATVVIGYSAAVSASQASRSFALRRLSDSLIGKLADVNRAGEADSVLVGVPALKAQEWTGLGPTLARFARATGRQLPDTRDILCSDAERLTRAMPAGVVVATLDHQCRVPGLPQAVSTQLAYRFDFRTFRLATDTLRARIFMPLHPGSD